MVIEINSLTELSEAARQLACLITQYKTTVVALEGEMGAGKTALVRALCAELGVADDVSSPTFGLVHEYRNGHSQPVYHFDFYRIETEDEARHLGTAEYFDSGYLCLVEWPGRVAALLPADYLHIELLVTGPDSRQLSITNE